MNLIKQIFIETNQRLPDANIKRFYEIQKSAWVWHPDSIETIKSEVFQFKCNFHLSVKTTFVVHVSADNRYELYLDKQMISRGPHRCDQFHWAFSSYELTLPAGDHEFLAISFWLKNEAPEAQRTIGHGGFIFNAEGELGQILNTGVGKWLVAKWVGWEFKPNELTKKHYFAIGHLFHMNGELLSKDKNWVTPALVMKSISDHSTGLIRAKWKLQPTTLPELIYNKQKLGKVCGLLNEEYIVEELSNSKNIEEIQTNWQNLIKGQGNFKIAANKSLRILIDLNNYYCAYPVISLLGGKNSLIKISWAESLYVNEGKLRVKGNRDQIIGKKFVGLTDSIAHDGSGNVYKPLWWRCGRYIMLEVITQDEPLEIQELAFIETRYPIENDGRFDCSDASYAEIIPIMIRGFQSCAHETFMDCPYYEQLMYVGDTRIEMLVNYIISGDDRLVRRCIELFDWSRHSTGFVMERYPSHEEQLSLTFSLIWPLILKDYSMWRNDEIWVKQRITGMRCMLENMRVYLNEEGLLNDLPGWSFLDWVEGWHLGMHNHIAEGPSSIINLFYVLALQAASDLENEYGDAFLAKRNKLESEKVAEKIIEKYWDQSRGILSDDIQKTSFSEHAQSLAIIADILKGRQRDQCIEGLLTDKNLHRATVYFTYYLFEAYQNIGKAYILEDKIEFWREMKKIGLKTTLEHPEPTRSDCHAWGAHPLFHFYTSLAGIRPSSFGYKTLTIKPQVKLLTTINCKVPHPTGFISLNLEFKNNIAKGEIELPEKVTGEFVWNNQTIKLKGGKNTI